MNDLTKLFPVILRAAGDSPELLETTAFAAWRKAAGAGLRDHAVPFRLHGKTLIVAVADQTWREQMEDMSGQLLFRVNSILGRPVITFIEYRIDAKTIAQSIAEARATAPHPQLEQKERERRALASAAVLRPAAECIKDEELRHKFLLAAGSCIDRLNREARRRKM